MKFGDTILASFIGTFAGMAGAFVTVYALIYTWWTSPLGTQITLGRVIQTIAAAMSSEYVVLWGVIAVAFLVEGGFIAWGIWRVAKALE